MCRVKIHQRGDLEGRVHIHIGRSDLKGFGGGQEMRKCLLEGQNDLAEALWSDAREMSRVE